MRSHTTKDIKQIITDEKFCTDLNEDLFKLRTRCKIRNTPSTDYLIKNFTIPDTSNYRTFATDFKQLIIGMYITLSGKWPEMTNKYGDNWDVTKLAIDADDFITYGLDLCNLRNKTTHGKMEETWKNDQLPYAYECLRQMVVSFEVDGNNSAKM